MPTCDTSWLYALIDDRDPHHDEAQQKSQGQDNFLIPAVALAELLQVIFYRTRKLQGDRAAHLAERSVRKNLLNLPEFRVEQAFDANLASAIHDRHATLSYVDAVVTAAALRSPENLLSFDKQQLAAFSKERKEQLRA